MAHAGIDVGDRTIKVWFGVPFHALDCVDNCGSTALKSLEEYLNHAGIIVSNTAPPSLLD